MLVCMQVSALLLGACFGALFAGRCADGFGPRTMLLAINVFLVSGSVLSAAAQDYSELLVGNLTQRPSPLCKTLACAFLST